MEELQGVVPVIESLTSLLLRFFPVFDVCNQVLFFYHKNKLSENSNQI